MGSIFIDIVFRRENLGFLSHSLIILFSLIFGVSCAETEQDRVADAQYCLDKSTQDTAMSCLSKVDGLNSSAANLIRCSALFIEQGFSDPSRMVSITNQMSSGSTGSASNQVMAVLAFKRSDFSTDLNYEKSGLAISYCGESKSSGLAMLASISRMATAVLRAAGSIPENPTATDIQNAMCSNNAPTEVIGSAAQLAYDTSCNGSDKNSLFCVQYRTAIQNGTTPTQIGENLASSYCTPTH